MMMSVEARQIASVRTVPVAFDGTYSTTWPSTRYVRSESDKKMKLRGETKDPPPWPIMCQVVVSRGVLANSLGDYGDGWCGRGSFSDHVNKDVCVPGAG